jgi:hypothetical protein
VLNQNIINFNKMIIWTIPNTSLSGKITEDLLRNGRRQIANPIQKMNAIYDTVSGKTGLNDLVCIDTRHSGDNIYMILVSKNIRNKILGNEHIDIYGALYVTEHSGDYLYGTHFTKEILVITRIIKYLDESTLVIKLLRPIQVNWDHGPTCETKFLVINSKTKSLHPLYTDDLIHDNFEKNVYQHKEIKYYPSMRIDYDYNYKSLESQTCVICLERESNQYCGCGSGQHLVLCEPCSKTVSKCPICREDIKMINPVIYL